EILKKDFRSLVELVRTTSPTTRIIVSGPLPTFQRGIESDDITDHHLLVYTLPVEHIRHVSPRYRLGEDSFELHSVDLELEAVEKQIRDLQVKQAQLRQRKAALESPSARTRPAQVSFTPAPGVPRSLDAAAAEDASQAPGEDLSPSAATRLRDLDPEPLRSPSRDGVRHGTRDPEEEHRSCGPPCWHERHQAEADGDPEEGLQEPGGAGEDSFELHSVDLELEAVEKQIRDLQVKQAQLRQRKAALESSRTDAHLSQVNSRRETITPTTSTPCASLPRPSARTRPAQVSFTPAPGYHAAWMQQQRKTRAKPRARTSPPPPPPVFEIPTQNRFAPLRETECDTVIIGDSIVRHVRATAAKGKVHTRCLPGARVLDVSAQVPAILKKNIGAVVLHAGTNDIRLRQTEILKKDFRSLVELVRTTSPTTRIIVSGPLPTFQRGIE
ncbi:hypothetical protein QTP70_002292, partial [Hemibagrus guttatus]